VLEILAAKQRARVEGVAMIKRHLKKSQESPAKAPLPSAKIHSTSQLMALAQMGTDQGRQEGAGRPK